MFTIYAWMVENYQLIIAIGVLIVALSLTGSATQTIRSAKKGLKEAVTPLGFLVLITIIYICYRIYLSMMETI